MKVKVGSAKCKVQSEMWESEVASGKWKVKGRSQKWTRGKQKVRKRAVKPSEKLSREVNQELNSAKCKVKANIASAK